MTGYEYDVFLSYRRGKHCRDDGSWDLEEEGRWVHKVFFPKFRSSLQHASPDAHRIAFDENLTPGDSSLPRLREWHGRSKCLVAVFCPMYFRSAHCRSEFRSMVQRTRSHPIRDPSGSSLVLPVLYYGNFIDDEEAKPLQVATDFSEFTGNCQRIVGAKKEERFTHAMRRFCTQVSAAIRNAPDYDSSFPWTDWPALSEVHEYPVPRLQ